MRNTREKLFTALLATTALCSVALYNGAATAQDAGEPQESADEALVLDPLLVEGQSESAYGPVEGPYAAQSATGTKTDTPLIETPQSITVIPSLRLEKQGATSLSEALRYSSGITGENRGGVVSRYDMFNIRGFDIRRGYLDGLIQPYNGWYNAPQADTAMIERVEILKGPASVLYGNATPGGLVNLVTKKPSTVDGGRVTLGAGTNNLIEGTVDMTGSLDENGEFSYRFIGAGRSQDGQAVTTEEERRLFAPSLTWAPTDATNITFLGFYQHDPESGAYGSAPVLGTVLDNPLGNLSPDFYDGDAGWEEFNRKQYGAGYIFSHDFDEVWSFRQNFRYDQLGTDYKSVYANGLQADNRTLNRASIYSDEYTRAFAIDNQLTARFETGAVDHLMLGGLDYQYMNSDIEVGYGGAPGKDIYNPDHNQTIPPIPMFSNTNIKTNQTGFYLQDQMQWNGFTLMLGARQDWYERESFEQLSSARSNLEQDELTLRTGLLYKFESGFAPYIAYTESFEPQTATDASGQPLDPSLGEQVEVGIKYEAPNERAFVTFSLFDLKKTNVATDDPNPAAPPNASIAAGEVTSQGFEIEAQLEPLDGWNIAAFYTLLDLEITKSNDGFQGKMPLSVADETASLWTDYTISEGSLGGLTLGGGARYVGETQVDQANTLQTDPYTLFDAMVSYDLGRVSPQLQGTSLQLNGTNIFDKEHVTSCYNALWCWFGAERQVKLTLAYEW